MKMFHLIMGSRIDHVSKAPQFVLNSYGHIVHKDVNCTHACLHNICSLNIINYDIYCFKLFYECVIILL